MTNVEHLPSGQGRPRPSLGTDQLLRRARQVAGVGRRELKELLQEALYRVEHRQQAAYLPGLDALGTEAVRTLEKGELAVIPVDDLALPSTAAMADATARVLASMWPELESTGERGEPLIRMASNVPELRAWATERSLLAIASNYIGVPATFQGVHARIDRVNDHQVTSEQWHRDLEDRRMLKAFYFPKEVTFEHGPFEYIADHDLDPALLRQVHRASRSAVRHGRMGLTDDEMGRLVDRSLWRSTVIPARSVVLADPTASFHHGRRRSKPRESLFFVYTSAFPRHPEHCTQYWNDRYPAA